MAKAERIDPGYLGTILQLTLLAPDIIEAALSGRATPLIMLPNLLKPLPVGWGSQRQLFDENSAVKHG